VESTEVSYISDERGEVTGVVVPIAVWREIRSELETHHLLKSDTMRRRLLGAMSRTEGIPPGEAIDRLGIQEQEVDDE